MVQRWKAVMAWVMNDPAQPLEKQFFQGLCLLGGALTLFVVLPVNLLQHLSPWVNWLLIPPALGLLGLAWAARRGHYHRVTALVLIIVGLDLVWFPNGGSQGSIGLYFVTPALFLVVVFKGAARIAGFLILVGNIIGLHLAETAWPGLAHSFTPIDRLIDLSTGYLLSLLVSSLMMWVILTGFYREKERITESEHLYRDLLNSQGEGFGMVDGDERFLVVNPVAEEIFGLAPGQLVGRSLLEFVPLEQHGEVRRQTTLRRNGAHSTYEMEIRRGDGVLRTLMVTATPRPSDGSAPLQIIGVFRDISERKEAEARLLESEEKFRTYIEQSIDVIFTLDAQGVFLFASPAWERHFGYPVREILGNPFGRFVHPEDLEPCFDYLIRVLSAGQSETSPPYRVRRADGSWRWFMANGSRISLPDTEPRFMGVAHDITERKEAEEALKASEERYRAQFDRASEGIFTLSPDGALLEVNEAMARMHGYTIEEMLRLNLKDLDSPASSELAPGRMLRLLAGEALTLEVEHRHKDGHAFPLEVSASLVTVGGKQTILCFHRDISERKQAEETNHLLVQEKHQAQKMDSLGSLAGGVAHDFNNMLGGIMGYADLMLAGEADPKRQKYLRSILAAASRSAELTQKLLAFGRRGKNIVEAIDLRFMVNECLSILRPSMNPEVKVVIAMEECPIVDGDPSQIHQVLVNLLLNAIEAMPASGTLTITSRAMEVDGSWSSEPSITSGTYAELLVSDTGMGMTEDIRQRVFEPFFTTKKTSGSSGTGLGLSTAYGIIHAHRGAISADSILGKGSTFRVLLPKGTLTAEKGAAPMAVAQGKGMVLLVEDEPILRDLGTTILESLGYEVLAAADGVEAVETYRDHHARLSVIVLDLKMPRMDGRGAFLEIQKINPKVPVIICTGYGENEEVQDLLTRGAAGMLAKPYQVATLAATLRQVAPG